MTCETCGLSHTGPCQDAIRKHYEGRIAELEKYAQHKVTCRVGLVRQYYERHTDSDIRCTCGLDEALKERE